MGAKDPFLAVCVRFFEVKRDLLEPQPYRFPVDECDYFESDQWIF
jgi:hypothetical protein